jgi:hypothetical protein
LHQIATPGLAALCCPLHAEYNRERNEPTRNVSLYRQQQCLCCASIRVRFLIVVVLNQRHCSTVATWGIAVWWQGTDRLYQMASELPAWQMLLHPISQACSYAVLSSGTRVEVG